MAKARVSHKQTQLDKSNSRMVITIAVAAFLIIFSLVASQALWKSMAHQAEVIGAKEQARDQLDANIKTVDDIGVAYKAFVTTSENVLDGNPAGEGDRDGDNAKIVLDALPSKYDFPGLATSLEKIIRDNGSEINSISGIDDEVAQSAGQDTTGPIQVPFEMSATGNYKSAQDLLALLQRSIRPIQVQTLELSGANSELVTNLTALTYYQPERTLKVQTKVIK